MKTNIVQIGNSRGIRIPKIILEQCEIENEAIMEVEDKNIILKTIRKKPRKDWEQCFKKMKENEDDQLVIDDNVDLDMVDWEW